MKINEWILTGFNVGAAVFCYAVGMIPQGIFLTVWLFVFGMSELICKRITGTSLSGHVWRATTWKRVVLSILMIGGMITLGWHFIWGM